MTTSRLSRRAQLERRAMAYRVSLLGTLDVLERRRARLVSTLRQARRLAVPAVVGVLTIGLLSLGSLLRTSRRAPASAPRRLPVVRLSLLGLAAAAAFLARRAPRERRLVRARSSPEENDDRASLEATH